VGNPNPVVHDLSITANLSVTPESTSPLVQDPVSDASMGSPSTVVLTEEPSNPSSILVATTEGTNPLVQSPLVPNEPSDSTINQAQPHVLTEHQELFRDNHTVTDIGPVDLFLESISRVSTPPILPDPIIQENHQILGCPETTETAPVTNKRQSSHLTAKAQSRIGKNALQIAQDLLVKKLGELSPVKQNFKGPDIESFSQFFDRPINKEKMETFQVLVDHGGKKPNNGGTPRSKFQRRRWPEASRSQKKWGL
jgi:hypothetical protein